MEIFDPSVADRQAEKNEIDMLKSSKNKANLNSRNQATSLKVAVIKNGHTNTELAESGERWANHEGPYLTLAEVIAIESAKSSLKR
jgi:hypothetical protein